MTPSHRSDDRAPRPPREPADAVLIRAAQAGDAESFGEIVARYERSVLAVVRAQCPSCSAEDLAQTAFVDAWRGLAGFDAARPFAPWLYAIARNAARRARQRSAGEPAQIEALNAAEPLPALGAAAGWGCDPERHAAAMERLGFVQEAMTRLSPEDRELLWLRDVEGMSGSEVAEATGASLSAVKSRLHRARLRLMAELREETR